MPRSLFVVDLDDESRMDGGRFMEGKLIRYFPDRTFGYLRELDIGKDWFFHFDDCGDFSISPVCL